MNAVLEEFLWYYLLDQDLFHVCTKFHGNWPTNIEILEGGHDVPPLGLVDLKIAWA